MTKQRTVKDQVILKGVGLQTGKPVSMSIKPAPQGSGINFIRTDIPNKPLLNINSISLDTSGSPERRTSLAVGSMQIQTIEHLMAALSGLSIDNVSIELDSEELPGMDGSAKDFVTAIRKAGIVEQIEPRPVLKIKEPVWCREGDSLIAVLPDDNFRISYTLSYPSPSIGTQYLSLMLTEEAFETDIAPARTFCLEEEAVELIKRGLGKGANYDNTLVMGRSTPMKTALRFPDEPVRHKILDLIGDLYLLGMPVKGHVVAIKSGHKLNMELVKKLKKGA
ncbi:MAG: UDP-3-O-acyl-N-acetylglucosamine deacetylase [Candidatus Omnitrophica bacterium]|nr:UDP-3-O-acyl-N-acetylglucosamine deacetylase [Candidatus Omnitrophota bacterium]